MIHTHSLRDLGYFVTDNIFISDVQSDFGKGLERNGEENFQTFESEKIKTLHT